MADSLLVRAYDVSLTVPPILEPSVKSLLVFAQASDNALGTATAFVAEHDGTPYLVTNWHVVTGRRPDRRVVDDWRRPR